LSGLEARPIATGAAAFATTIYSRRNAARYASSGEPWTDSPQILMELRPVAFTGPTHEAEFLKSRHASKANVVKAMQFMNWRPWLLQGDLPRRPRTKAELLARNNHGQPRSLARAASKFPAANAEMALVCAT
jgi:hypothetical protein